MKKVSKRVLDRAYIAFKSQLKEINGYVYQPRRDREMVRVILAAAFQTLEAKRTEYLNKRRKLNVKARNVARKANYARGRFIDTKRKHRLWTNEELEIIIFSLLTDREISKMIHRTVQAIQMKRYLLRKNGVDDVS